MSWRLISRTATRPGVRADLSAHPDLVDLHDLAYVMYGSPCIASPISWTETSGSAVTRAHWRVRGNEDLQPVLVLVRAKSSAAGATITANVGAANNTATVSSSEFRWFAILVTPAASGVVDCNIQTQVSSGTLTVAGVAVWIAADDPAAGVLDSGFIRAAGIGAADYPITSEHERRLLDGPRRIAIDRPAVVAAHLADVTATVSSKSYGVWGSYDTDRYDSVGRLFVPRFDREVRVCTLDAYVTATAGGSEFRVDVGGQVWTIAPSTSAEWQSTTMVFPPDDSEIRVAVRPSGSVAAAVRTLQVWRT